MTKAHKKGCFNLSYHRTAILCNKWEMPFYIDVQPEYGVDQRLRSYAHFVATQPELVAAKCLATEWILGDTPPNLKLVEFFGGVGFVSVIAEALLSPNQHQIYEIDDNCIKQLRFLFHAKNGIYISKGDAKETILQDTADIVSLDFPNFTILDIRPGGRWETQFATVFQCSPQGVLFTDTATSYFHVHKERYSKCFGRKLITIRDYILALSAYLQGQYGYGISRVAYRGRNAVYLYAEPGRHIMEENIFPVEESANGFAWKN